MATNSRGNILCVHRNLKIYWESQNVSKEQGSLLRLTINLLDPKVIVYWSFVLSLVWPQWWSFADVILAKISVKESSVWFVVVYA